MIFSRYILFCFKLISVSTAFAMAGYWIHKYAKNQDNTIIEYKSYRNSNSEHLPAMSICFVNPFVTSNVSSGNNNNSRSKGFLRYLQGKEDFNKYYGDILYNIKAFNISHYLEKVGVFHYLTDELGNDLYKIYSNLDDCPFLTFENNFNGLYGGMFAKCFELKIKKKYSNNVKLVVMYFKETFLDILSASEAVGIIFSFPGQMLLEFSFDHILRKNPNETDATQYFKMDSIEMIKRRNKKNDRCLENSMDYDDLRILQAVEKAGCKAIYHNILDDIPICENYDRLASFDLSNMTQNEFLQPCDEIPQVSYKLVTVGYDAEKRLYPFGIGYPRKMKLISQQRAIDIHALIGNIGGYIGLFLGGLYY